MLHYGVGRSFEGCAAAASENSSGPWESRCRRVGASVPEAGSGVLVAGVSEGSAPR